MKESSGCRFHRKNVEVAAVFVMAWGMVFLTGTQSGVSGIGRKSRVFLVW
ncbi:MULTISPECIES: hypothetical protein [Clostridium]|nr:MULTISPECIES: hypothetical protein [Clostridium]